MEGDESQRQSERRGTSQACCLGLPRQRQVQQDVAGYEGSWVAQLCRGGGSEGNITGLLLGWE